MCPSMIALVTPVDDTARRTPRQTTRGGTLAGRLAGKRTARRHTGSSRSRSAGSSRRFKPTPELFTEQPADHIVQSWPGETVALGRCRRAAAMVLPTHRDKEGPAARPNPSMRRKSRPLVRGPVGPDALTTWAVIGRVRPRHTPTSRSPAGDHQAKPAKGRDHRVGPANRPVESPP